MTFHALRERLEGLMLFRVLLVTLFLGSALALDVEGLADLSNVRNATILVLIVGTYGLTIVYALLLRKTADLAALAVMQLTLDVVIVMVLVEVSEGLNSPFLFLFQLAIIDAAVVLGRRAALYTAVAAAAALGLLAAEKIGLFAPVPAPGVVWKDTIFKVVTNSAAGFIIAVLAGYLSERLGEATTQLAEQQVSIRELKALNANILASLSSGLVTIDDDDTVIFFNRAAEQITGRSSEEVLGEPFREVLPTIADAIASPSGGEGRQEARYARTNGKDVYLGFSTSPLLNADAEAVGQIVIFQDLSEIKQMEEQMRRSERLAAIGTLSAAIAHEIRNPLASISGSVEMLSGGDDIEDDDRVLMSIVLREVERLDELISEFLEYSRPRELQLVTQDVTPTVESVLELFDKRQTDGLEVNFEAEVDLPRARLDSEAFQQVVWNLVNNATEATGSEESPRIDIGLFTRGTDVVLRIEDNGPGISPDDLERVFQPFFTTKKTGTGLGLATIYRIVEDHDGQVEVLPHGGELGGACFEIVLPSVPNNSGES
jgi:two-component system sensor histidine kinase PilS (NtrC family)